MWVILVNILFLHFSTLFGSDQFQVVGPAGPLVAVAGEDLVLPCSLKPNFSAVDMTVKWFRLRRSDTLVHLYTEREDRNENQIQSYRGRTALFKEELQKGNTSLKLSRVRFSDEGKYRCLIDNQSWQGDVTVEVIVEAVGTEPVITVTDCDDSGRPSLSCESTGWHPEVPVVSWLNSEGETLPAEDTETFRDTEGLSVKRVIVQDSNANRLFCRVTMRDHMKEAEIFILFCRKPVIWALMVIIPSGIFLIMLIILLYRKGQIQKAEAHLAEMQLALRKARGTERKDLAERILSALLENPHCKLEELWLADCKLRENSCAALASVLSSESSSLRELDLSMNSLKDSGVKLLVAGLGNPNCKLDTLRLVVCELTDKSCDDLASVLRSNSSSLRVLDLDDNKLSDSGVEKLCVGLKDSQCKLEILWLRWCGITDEGCAALASALTSNPSHLRELYLNFNNNITDTGKNRLSALKNDPQYKLKTLEF